MSPKLELEIRINLNDNLLIQFQADVVFGSAWCNHIYYTLEVE